MTSGKGYFPCSRNLMRADVACLPCSAAVPTFRAGDFSAYGNSSAGSGSTIPSSSAFCRTPGSRSSLYVLGRRLAFCHGVECAGRAVRVSASSTGAVQRGEGVWSRVEQQGARAHTAIYGAYGIYMAHSPHLLHDGSLAGRAPE